MSLWAAQRIQPQRESLVWTGLGLLLTTFIVQQIRQWYRLRHIPGPRLAGWSILWQLSGALSGRYHEILNEVAEEYGPLVRIGPNELLSTDPEVVRRISGVRSRYQKGRFYDSGKVTPGVDTVVSMRDEEEHRAMRAKMWAGYAGRASEGSSFEPGMDRQITNFMDLLERKYISTAERTVPFDLAQKTQFFALDAIGDISMGTPFGYLAKDEDLFDYNEINRTSLPVMNVVSVLPWLTDIVHQWPFRLALPKDGDNVGFGRLMTIATQLVDARLDPQSDPMQDMLQAHINSGMSREELVQQVFIFIIAGANSSSQALRMIFLALVTNPTAYNSLCAEIREASGTVSSPISWAETQSLPYLKAVVQEGFRMWPPVGGLGFKTVPPEGDNIAGYFIPGGTDVGQGFHGIGRSKAVWGQDANVFRPERWLTSDKEELRSMQAAVDTHFGAGKYSCLGKPIALMELHKAVFELLRRYDLGLIDPERPIKVESSIFHMASDFWVKLTKRSN